MIINYDLLLVFSYTIALAAIIGIFRYKRILKSYRPFVYFTWLGLLGEVISLLCTKLFHSTAANTNIYTLIEYLVLLWLFACWNGTYGKPNLYYYLAGVGSVVWVIDNLVIYNIHHENSIFRIFYSLVLAYLSVDQINQLLFNREKNIIYNSKFIICTGFIIYFSYRATFEIFFLVPVNWSIDFYKKIFTVFVFVNLVSNILYTLAVLCIPKKQKFILPY